jgi:hypothetical protein
MSASVVALLIRCSHCNRRSAPPFTTLGALKASVHVGEVMKCDCCAGDILIAADNSSYLSDDFVWRTLADASNDEFSA